MQKIDYADKATETLKVGGLLKGAGLKFLTDIVAAKEQGKGLPPFLDKIATLGSKAKAEGVEMGKQTLKEQALKYLPWVALAGIGLYVVLKKK